MGGSHSNLHKFSIAGALVALGIIYGDIGTSVLYVFKAIIGEKEITQDLVYGGMSCVFWTLTLITSVKYVLLALNADNKGEGGIFALYALVRRFNAKWVVYPAIIGCAALIADGFITPPISISSAIEGLALIPEFSYLKIEPGHVGFPPTVPIVITILIILFVIQQFGTNAIGKAFGPIMTLWFATMIFTGISQIVDYPSVIQALSPHYAWNLLVHYPNGFWILGAVFLCTTGAEALYSDLGHCGKKNIQFSWFTIVKVALIINYLGQAAWLMKHTGGHLPEGQSPFFLIVTDKFGTGAALYYTVFLATAATIIASQALITGTFTITNEAMKLKFWPNLKVNYPTQLRGQIYIPAMNWFLMFGCIGVVLFFKESSHMEHAYGLAIMINMLMTTSLITYYLHTQKRHWIFIGLFLIVFLAIEGAFFASNIVKFGSGGYFTFMVACVLFFVMFIMLKARDLRNKFTEFAEIKDYSDAINDLSNDHTLTKEATNLVYLCRANDKYHIDKNIIYSILRKRPKRADTYWFLHVEILDDPTKKFYEVNPIIDGKIYFVRLFFGFKVEHKVNLMFSKIIEEMAKKDEIDEISHYPSLRKYNIPADFKFILLNSRVSVDDDITPFEQFIVRGYRFLKSFSLSTEEDFGLDTTNVEVETVPINIGKRKHIELYRLKPGEDAPLSHGY